MTELTETVPVEPAKTVHTLQASLAKIVAERAATRIEEIILTRGWFVPGQTEALAYVLDMKASDLMPPFEEIEGREEPK